MPHYGNNGVDEYRLLGPDSRLYLTKGGRFGPARSYHCKADAEQAALSLSQKMGKTIKVVHVVYGGY